MLGAGESVGITSLHCYGSSAAAATACIADATSVPEPGTAALIGLGLFGFGLARRRSFTAA